MKPLRKRRVQETVELNITAFLNLMVILVPFLLITAVFSRLIVLELNLPALNAKAKQQEKVKLQLQVLIQANEFVIQDASLGVIQRFQRQQGATDWNAFSEILLEIKRRFPEETSITLLLDKSVDYKTLIQAMDRVRSADIVDFTELQTVELFPNISIGDTPVAIDEEIQP